MIRDEPYWRFMCDECESRNSVETGDVCRSLDDVYYVNCQVCGHAMEVPPMLLATPVKHQARLVTGFVFHA
jgi:transcription elongation factor Elf1